MEKAFSVWAQNLGYYNDGELVGGWIDLPQTKEKIDEYLKNIVKVNDEYEEYEIADTDGYPFEYNVIQWGDLHKINDLAAIYSELSIDDKEKITMYMDAMGLSDLSIDKIINLCLQVNDIPYYSYCFEGMDFLTLCSNELKMGYTMTEENGLYTELERLDIVNFFDFEAYGEMCGYNYELYENGYIDTEEQVIDLEFYTRDEINEKVEEILNSMQIEKEEVVIEI